MSLDVINAEGIEQGLQRWAANPGPDPGTSFRGTAALSAIPQAALEATASFQEMVSGMEALGLKRDLERGSVSPEQKESREDVIRRLQQGAAATRKKAQDFAPDPLTTHTADQVIGGLVRFGAKAVTAVGTLGPVGGAVALGAEEGNTATRDLLAQGVDPATAAKVGAVQGVISATGVVLPLGGRTIAQTIGLVGVGGPGSYMAQEQISHDILQQAGYKDLASLHNPFDPLGLALSTVIPGGFGALHVRGQVKRAGQVKEGTLPLQQLRPEELRALPYDDARLDAFAAQTAERYGVPPALLLAIKNAGEKSGPTAVSPKGAQGVMQFMPGTAREMGLADPTDPIASIDAGARYMRKLFDAYGSWEAAVAHYNGGGAQAAIVRGGGEPTAKETKGYLSRVRQYMREHTAGEASQNQDAVDASRVATTNEAMTRALPDTPDALGQVQRASDIVAATSGRDAQQVIPAPIPRADRLTAAERAIEDRLAQKLGGDLDAAFAEYASRPDSKGGKVLNTDTARELSPDYMADRTQSAAVHEPASWFIKQLYEQKLAQLTKGDSVLFTSGGTGAGKTTAIDSVEAARQMQNEAAIVYDTNMNSLGSAVKKIEQALDAGAQVQIVHVQRDPVEALVNGALPRAMNQERKYGSGRTVPLAEHGKTHTGAAEVIQQLAERYKDNPNVGIAILDNTHGKGGAKMADLDFVRTFDYNGLEGKLNAALEAEHQAGRVSEAVYRATGNRQGEGPPLRRDDGAQPQRGDLPQGGNALPDPGQVGLKGDEPAPRGAELGQPEGPPSAGDKTAGAGEPQSLDQQLVQRLATEQPDLRVVLPGVEGDFTVAEALERIAQDQKQDGQWADLVKVAAECALQAGA